MRLIWQEDALVRLEEVVERAPRQAARIVEAVERLAATGFPRRHRFLPENPGHHVLTVRPYAVIYAHRGDDLIAVTIIDSRRRREPWL